MLHLLKIDLKKLTNYRTFWIVCGMYFITLTFVTASGMEVLKFLADRIEDFGGEININRIPLYHFPDVWQNLIFVSGFFKFILGVMVIISVTNEFAYRTLRQNVIDGLSRWEFIQSKILTNAVLAGTSAVLLFLIALITGMIYSPELHFSEIIDDVEFFPAYFLQVFGYLSFALFLGVFINRSGLTIIVLMLARALELFVIHKVVDVDVLNQFFPLESMEALITLPFQRYVFMEVLDHPLITTVLVAAFWTVMFNYFAYLKLKKSDI
jgi:ABC-type transport system involved in multi-copper enzyme maturation permease subunit